MKLNIKMKLSLHSPGQAVNFPGVWGLQDFCTNNIGSSEVCHPLCVFKLYGEVNSVKNTTINIWLNDGVY